MADFDPIVELIKPFSGITLHNVKLVDVKPADAPHEVDGRAVVMKC